MVKLENAIHDPIANRNTFQALREEDSSSEGEGSESSASFEDHTPMVRINDKCCVI